MAIVDMNKFTLMAFQSHREDLLLALQRFENAHFKDLRQGPAEDALSGLYNDGAREQNSFFESELAKIRFALERLAPYVEKPKGLAAMRAPDPELGFEEFQRYAETYDYQTVYNKVKAEDEKRKSINGERNKLKAENDNLKNWTALDVAPGQLERLKNAACFLGVVSKTPPEVFREAVESQLEPAYVEVLGNVKDETAVLVIVPKDMEADASSVLKNLGYSKYPLPMDLPPAEQIEKNLRQIAELDKQDEAAGYVIRELTTEHPNLLIAADYYVSALERVRSRDNFLKTDQTLLIEGWIPAAKSGEMADILKNVCGDDYYLEESPEDRDSTEVPIKLKNNKIVSAFEGVTSMYALPKYNEIDPTILHMPFYIAFFGLMVGDAGYGLVMLIGTFLALKFLNLKGMRNFIMFFHILSFGVIGAGLVYGSFFGFSFFTPIPVRDAAGSVVAWKAILDTDYDIQTMIIFAIGLGVFQVLFGFGVKGYLLIRDGKPFSAIFDSLIWIILLLSGIGMILGMTGIFSPVFSGVCLWLLIAMLAGVLLTQGRNNKSFAGKLGQGVYDVVFGTFGVVGDLVSYSRIAALALSSAYIGYAFIIMSTELLPNLVLRIIFGSAIFLFGTLLNMGLAALGGYVHTCRLQYVEYFGKFFEGGGKAFKPLRMMVKSIRLK